MAELISIRNLKTYFQTERGIVKAIDGIDLDISRGETLALVGESGCGKSMTALSILRLVPEPGRIVSGEIRFDGQDLLRLPEPELRRIRGNRISMIFQEPMTSLNPVFRVGEQIAEALRLHRGMNRGEALRAAADLMTQVGIPEAGMRLADYPHQLSGGLRQRVMIAMALACDPALLIADEPTTALDVTIQAQIMDLLLDLQRERGMATLLISHDLGVVAESADRVAIMYAGLIVETAATGEIFGEPLHPYTRGLLDCIPKLGEERQRLNPIPGQVPDIADLPPGCAYAERCPLADGHCRSRTPGLKEMRPGHLVRCWKCR
ncbi:peptide/nickel transport system ATP-binding protein/oligopeptide transport system ATP-binding protein [Geothermobacter ehrlichii]|uniref:Peptide/nickel transport system ATP-binding protein/oligopeptide transport system ATP-binding protein n=1 Tax=Geothermobacter ehrlichii TaxID=213224 RepID=A0A5D3WL31_9BACT|nr:ABC transporter ATP-binding protein [Geothermobacter ehrlichii]TYO98223.1 peptide/nickel transport system ATP-binding protein/oligopeptide transport system ATP-binding protein [Geothermobacter ehrlichii]